MLAGAYLATRKDGSVYYRSNITYKNKHISLGSFSTEDDAHTAYLEAFTLLSSTIKLENLCKIADYFNEDLNYLTGRKDY